MPGANRAPARGQPVIALVAIPVLWALARVAANVPIFGGTGEVPMRPRSLLASKEMQRTPVPTYHSAIERGQAQRPFRQPRTEMFGPASAGLPNSAGTIALPIPANSQPESGAIGLARVLEVPPRPLEPYPASSRKIATVGRWSADAWVTLRQGPGPGPIAGAALPVYGASQAGAVVRYNLAPQAPWQPAGFVRLVQALNGAAETDLAAGLSARVVRGLPVTAHLEARASRRADRIDIRPAAFVATGVDRAPLPLGFQMRGYAQGGYVGGRDATAFADGSLIVERGLERHSATSVTAGAGVWGGAQRGSTRLDVGPSVGVRIPLGHATVRASLDYRMRVAGNAEPSGGVALTFSAGI